MTQFREALIETFKRGGPFYYRMHKTVNQIANAYPLCDHAQELLKACKHSLSVLNMLADTMDLVHRTLSVRKELETAIASAQPKGPTND